MMLVWITAMLFNPMADCAQITDAFQPNPVLSANVGENVTLQCFRPRGDKTGVVIWYKQRSGREPRVMLTVHQQTNYEDEFKPPKYSAERDGTSCLLKIAGVEASDEATYYCAMRGFVTLFGNGTYLTVKDDDEDDVKVSVVQSGVWDSVPAGGSRATLQCSVLSERTTAELRVLWFRSAPSQSHPQIIYTHHNNNNNNNTDQCRFSENFLSVNDTGTYYCAAVLCARIVFGTPVEKRSSEFVRPEVIFLSAAVATCALVIVAQAFFLCKFRPRDWSKVRYRQDSTIEKPPNLGGATVEMNYAALHFNKNNSERVTRKRENPADCVYSKVVYVS